MSKPPKRYNPIQYQDLVRIYGPIIRLLMVEAICKNCKTPYHPSTGHRLSPRSVLCWSCTLSYVAFVKNQMCRKTDAWMTPDHKGFRLADAAVTSIKGRE